MNIHDTCFVPKLVSMKVGPRKHCKLIGVYFSCIDWESWIFLLLFKYIKTGDTEKYKKYIILAWNINSSSNPITIQFFSTRCFLFKYWMINFFTTDHVVELYSTGCTKKDCNGAVGMIKMDGTQLGGGVDGMNIVVLSFPGMIIFHFN